MDGWMDGGQHPWNNALIIKYLKACPLPEAAKFVKRIASSDAEKTEL
jgi:hypothetical protein